VSLADALRLAETAEGAGFGIVTTGEGPAETFSLVGALAMRTTSVELFSSTATWTRTPVTTALAASTVAELTGGRYRLGIGAMPRAWSEKWHDVDYARPVERMRD
jgi:alkanesulfonate monooxygenase SsuD/methylene tetrahydromethanopterin reductase-like flavin-dependent oxidoreductase (luciferase family)